MQATTFGPGSLESIELRKRFRHVGFTRPQVRAVGFFTIYCGMGNDHSVRVDSGYVDTADVVANVHGSSVNDEDLAAVLVDWSTDDWSDPCDADK